MTDLQSVIGLLYRADWTRLSLSADVDSESDQDLRKSRVRATRPQWVPEGRVWRFLDPESSPQTWEEATGEELEGYNSWDTRLLIAPGGRYRQEYLDEPSGRVIGSDGERSWVWRPQDPAPPEPPVDVGPKPPLRQLFYPSELLDRFTLEVQGPVTACGRDAIAVVATPRTGIEPPFRPRADSLSDRLEVIVDAELGILLRYEETFEGQRLSLTELTAVVLDPPEAADGSRFRPPPGSQIGRDVRDSVRETSSGPAGMRRRPSRGWPRTLSGPPSGSRRTARAGRTLPRATSKRRCRPPSRPYSRRKAARHPPTICCTCCTAAATTRPSRPPWTSDAVSATRSFLDDLLGRSRSLPGPVRWTPSDQPHGRSNGTPGTYLLHSWPVIGSPTAAQTPAAAAAGLVSQRRTVPSALPAASICPSRLNATVYT